MTIRSWLRRSVLEGQGPSPGQAAIRIAMLMVVNALLTVVLVLPTWACVGAMSALLWPMVRVSDWVWWAAKVGLAGPPFRQADAVVRFFWSRRVYERVFRPLRAELLHEWHEAQGSGRRWQARWIRWARGPWTIANHILLQIPISILRRVIEICRPGL